MTPTTERLVFPRPASPRVRRIVLAVVVVSYAVLIAVASGFTSSPSPSARPWSKPPCSEDRSPSTLVTKESITVRGPFRTRTLSLTDAVEIVHPGHFGRHVLVTPKVGYKWQLPRATADDVEAIHALTGLPVRVSQHPE